MNRNLILLPLLVQVSLVLYAYILLSVAKSRATKARLVDTARRALHSDAWPDNVIQINNNIENQFELPVLFYVLVVVLWLLDGVGLVTLAAAWLFALSRIVHLHIHTGSNYLPLRRRVFTFGFLMVAILAGAVVFALLSA